ncbi:MAG: hypothetical protein MUE73_15055, partial [Planctomycetes bacterium]|nr:hypothetical protein [Planctomycetota bacterium]
MGRNGLGFLLAALLLPLPAARAGTTPRLEQVLLRVGHREAKPREIAPAIPGRIAAGPVRLTISDDSILGFQDASGRPAWTTAVPTGTHLRFLGHDGGETAFFGRTTRAQGREYFEPGDQGEVERLSLADGRWLLSLRPPDGGGVGTAGAERVRAVLVHEGRVMALASTDRVWRGGPHEPGPCWRITCFVGHEVAWSHTFPLSWFPGRERLGVLPSGLLVCAGPREDLLLLDPDTGATIAAIERVWEFRRLASLPFRSRSVLVRTPETDPGQGGEWERQGGPQSAPAHMPRLLDAPAVLFRPDGRARVFVPMGRRTDGAWQAGLCELNDRLEPVDVLALPPETR